MIQTIRKAWAIPELRKKIIFTLLILLIFRIGNAITVPYVDVGLLETYLDQMGGTILDGMEDFDLEFYMGNTVGGSAA